MSPHRAVVFVLLTLCAAPIVFAQSDSSSKPVVDQTNTTFDSSINVNDR